MTHGRSIVIIAFGLLLPQPAATQTPDALLESGVTSYQELDYATASAWLQQAVLEARRAEGAGTLVRALTYLGATQVFLGQPDSAAARFRSVLLLDPRNRIDGLIFPPEVTLIFDATRREILAVTLEIPGETVASGSGGELVAQLFTTSPHTITIDVRRAGSARVNTIFQGPAGDSLEVRWDLRIANQPVTTDRYFFSVRSEPSADGVTRVVTIPLDIERVRPDTLRHPPPLDATSFLPELEAELRGVKALPWGFAAAAAVLVIPAVVARESNLTETRFLVSGAITIASLARMFNPPRGRPILVNIEANAERRANWETRFDSVIGENATRLAAVRLLIHAGSPVISPDPRR